MNMPLISVIVPVYKAEAYLERCVNSICNQTYRNLEIILVDDGSPDRCGEMCDAFAKMDSRIRVFHKQNGGQSSARNLGLDNMTGQYVGFVDSDDWVEPDMYSHLYDLVAKYNAQIAACGLSCDYADGRSVLFNPLYPTEKAVEKFTVFDAIKEVTIAEKITNSPCDKLFHHSIFSDIRMSVGKIYEDFEMMPHCLSKAEIIVYDPKPLYHYFMTEQSTTRGSIRPERFLEAEIGKDRIEFIKKNYPELTLYAIADQVRICLNIYYLSVDCGEYTRQRNEIKQDLRMMAKYKVFPLLKKKDKLKYLSFLIAPWLFIALMKIYKRSN